MKILVTANLDSAVRSKYLYLDNDFLSELFRDKDVFSKVLEALDHNPIIIDPLTKFEFLRSIYLPSQLAISTEFVETETIFSPAPLNQEIFSNLQINALLLSKIYAQQNSGKGSSIVDLFLAARVMAQHNNYLLITGNKKDFPDCVFDVFGIISIRQKDESYQAYYIIGFNKGKFDNCLKSLQKLPSE